MSNPTRTSIIWTISKLHLQNILDASSSITEVLNKLGFTKSGGTRKQLNKRIIQDDLNLSNLQLNKLKNYKLRKGRDPISLITILVKNSNYNNVQLRKRLIKEHLLKNQCSICGLGPEWNGHILTLQLDHINGINNDNTLENLRLLCPNCHTQTDTHSGKNIKKKPIDNFFKCINCGATISQKLENKLCKQCFNIKQRKVERPPLDILLKEIEETNYCAVGRKYGVSDNAVRKWAKRYNN